VVTIVPSLIAERIESVKSGIVGAGAFAIAELSTILIKTIVVNNFLQYNLTLTVVDAELLPQLAIGTVSGFLFGVTYRYVIRDDRNSHLNDGAVLAFSLVRGLALVENHLILPELLFLLFQIIQSIICFAIARLILDLAMARQLIKPFT
jgi:hypothetical protein